MICWITSNVLHFTPVIIIIVLQLFCVQRIKGNIHVEPERISANLDENVILRCTFEFPDGLAVPYVIQWQKHGVKIPIYIWYEGYPPHTGDGYEGRVSLSGQASLNLTNVRENDQGWYECRVYFLNRPPEPIRNGTWVHLDVHAPPHFKLKPPDVIYVKVGESISMPCEAQGTPSPAIVWYKDNLPLDGSANVHILANELRITNLQQSDIGDYLCMARNREGSVTATTKVIIAGPAVITAPPRNVTKLEGDKVEMICEAKALPSNVTHRWFHNDVEISQLSWLETRTNIRRDGTLYVNPTSAEDSGKYTCEVFNGIGTPDLANAYLSVEYPARVTYSPTIQYLPHGLSGVVRCFIQASPPFQFITWTKDRRPFDPNATPGVVTLNNGSLLFQRVSHEHQGRYRCTPYNLHGTSGTSNVMEVLVKDPPLFTIKPNEIYQKSVNSEVRMPCDGVGQPKPNIIWRKSDGTKLPKDRAILRSGNLTIKSIKKEDHGKYECVLENEIATLVTSTLLLVNSTTPHAPTNVMVNTSAFAATITWQPNYNGGYEQTFHLRYRFSDGGDTDWKTIRVPQPESSTVFTLYNLQSDTDYDFQVFSSNLLGIGLSSPIVKARTKLWDLEKGIYPTDAYGVTYIPTVQKPSVPPQREHTMPATTGTTTAEPTSPASATTSVGPKPGMPRNVSIEKMAQGWVITWLPPINKSVSVAYYRIEYKEGDGHWRYTEPIPRDTAYLIKNLESGVKYTFRVWAYSILGVGEVSIPLEYKVAGAGDDMRGARAITAGIVGSVLFFVAAIVLSVCGVKICNKRKRRKMEKAYMMVTCPVMDGVNGGHSHGGSPVPLKQRAKKTGVSGLIALLIRSILQRFGGQRYQRRAAEPREVAGRSSSPSVQPVEDTVDGDWREPSRSYPLARRRMMRNVRYNVEMEYSRPLGWISRTPDGKFVVKRMPMYGKYGPNGHTYDLTPSNQASVRGSFRSDASGQSGPQRAPPPLHTEFPPQHRLHQPLITRSAIHSSLPSRTAYRTPSLSPQFSSTRSANISSIYRPRDQRLIRTSSPPGPGLPPDSLSIERELSSVRQPSSFELSSGLNPMISSASLHSQLRELPSLRPIHENLYRNHQTNHFPSTLRATVPMARQPNFRPINRGPLLLETVPEAIYDSAPHTPIYRVSASSARPGVDPGLWVDGRRRLAPQYFPRTQMMRGPSTTASSDIRPYQNIPFPRHLLVAPQQQTQQTIKRQVRREPQVFGASDEIRFSAPPKTVYKKPRAAPPPVPSPMIKPPLPSEPPPEATDVKSKFDTTGSDSSNGQPLGYTREHLLGAVEKVRSGMLLARASPYRHPDGFQTPTSLSRTPVLTPVDKAMFLPQPNQQPEQQLRQRRPTPVRFADDDEVFVDDNQMPIDKYNFPQPPSRTSITSASSGRGSSGQDGSGKTTSIIHSRGGSYQDDQPSTERQTSTTSIQSIQDKTTSSSSGIASRTLSSQLQSSTSPGQSSGISASSTSAGMVRIPSELQSRLHQSYSYPSPSSSSYQHRGVIESPESEPIFPSYGAAPLEPLDVSVDENYEFDAISPLEAELIEKLRLEQQRWRQWQQQQYQQRHRGPFSDSELYSTLPSRRRYDETEARCAAIKQEFFRFRRQQQLFEQQQQFQQRRPRAPFSDSELYGSLPARRRFDNTEARCAALKEEFFHFRRRQQLLQQQQQSDDSSSDEFESAC